MVCAGNLPDSRQHLARDFHPNEDTHAGRTNKIRNQVGEGIDRTCTQIGGRATGLRYHKVVKKGKEEIEIGNETLVSVQ